MIPSKHSTFIVLTRAVTAFGLPYYRYSFCGAQGRVRTGHTSILYIVKSKSGSMEKQVMQSRSKGASVWMNGWMNEWWYDLLLKALIPSLFYHPLIFFRHGYCRCLTTKLSEVYLEEIDCRQGHAKIRTRWCKEHKDLDRFRLPERGVRCG